MRTDIRQAEPHDFSMPAEIELFNYRLNFYPIFKDDGYYFGEMNAADMIKEYENTPALTAQTFVYDDGVVKGFVRVDGGEIVKLFVEPVLQEQSVGETLLRYAVENVGAYHLFALEKNVRAINFYQRYGFY